MSCFTFVNPNRKPGHHTASPATTADFGCHSNSFDLSLRSCPVLSKLAQELQYPGPPVNLRQAINRGSGGLFSDLDRFPIGRPIA
jgi:hypothetical protein